MFVIQNTSGKFFAGAQYDEEGHEKALWVEGEFDQKVTVFARKDAAKKAAGHFGGEVVGAK